MTHSGHSLGAALMVAKNTWRTFSDARLDIEIKDRFGKPIRPREWFLLPLPVIEQAIRMLIDGSILRYCYDPAKGEIIPS